MLRRNPYNELNPYSWADDHSLGKGTNGSFEFTPQRWMAKGDDSFTFWANGKRGFTSKLTKTSGRRVLNSSSVEGMKPQR